MPKYLLLAAFAMLCFAPASAQNAFDAAVLLYKWKTDKITDSASLKKVERILGNKDILSPELVKLRSVYQKRLFNAEIKTDKNELYERIARYISRNPGSSNPALKRIEAKYIAIAALDKEVKKWTDSINRLSSYNGVPDDSLTKNINRYVKSNCTDSAGTPCADSVLKKAVGKYVSDYTLKINNATIKSGQLKADILADISLLGQDADALKSLRIGITEIQEFNEQAREFRVNQPDEVVIITTANEKTATGNTSSLSNFKMPSESEIVDAVAIYLAKRVKQEAVIYFVENLRDRVTTTGLDTIFPETAKKFKGWKPYAAPNFDNSWRYAFSKDLVRLPRLGFKYLETHSAIVQPGFESYLVYIDDALAISEKVIKHYNFIGIVESLADDPKKARLLKSEGLRAFLRLTYIINQELYEANEAKAYWIASDKFTRTMNNDEVLRIFSEIIIKKYPDIAGYITVNLANLQGNDLFKLKSWISNVLMILNHFQENQNQTLGSDPQNFSVNNYWANLNEVINTVLSQQSQPGIIRNAGQFEKGLGKVNELFEVYQLLQGKNYAVAANNCVGLLTTFINENKPGSDKFINAAELVAFASEILQAQNKEQLSAAVESYALPPTSYRLKQNFSKVINIGAYFGPYGGAEFIRDENPGAVVGFSAPVSLDFTFNGNYKKPKCKSYTTWSIMVFDLGSVVSYRLTHSGGGLPEKARWAQLFAPGLAVRFGLGNTPLVFSLGAQMSPQLRDFSGQGHKDAVRLSAGLFIDMPLLLLHKK